MSKPIRVSRVGTRSWHQLSASAVTSLLTPQGVVAIVVVGVIILGFMLKSLFQSSSTVGAQPTPMPALAMVSTTPRPAPTSIPVTPTASCTLATTYLDVIMTQERAGQYDLAASTAELALRNQDLCDDDRAAIAGNGVAAGLEALYAEPFSPQGVNAQRAQVDRYLSLRETARQYQAAFPTNLQVARRAYSSGKFLLALRAFEEAFSTGEFTTIDREITRQYSSALFNLASWWLNVDTMKEEALQMLVTSALIDQRFRLGSGEARGMLLKVVGPEANWPPPIDTPLLVSR